MPYKDPERRKLFLADYYITHKDLLKARSQAHHLANRTKNLAAMKRRYVERSPEQRAAELAKGKRHRQKNPRAVQGYQLKTKYGIGIDTRDTIAAAQGHCCAICNIPESEATRGRLAIDHCHATGVIRGLLCDNCNKALGCFKDSMSAITRALEYLRLHGAKQ